MKPLLERKRRARINKCLDDLKDIMVSALQSEGESITKLEKADVLELTVRHLQKLKRQNALGLTPQATYAGRFKAGYAHCAQAVSQYMTSQNDINLEVKTRLFSHLGNCIQALDSMPPSVLSMATPTTPPMASPLSPVSMTSPPLAPASSSYSPFSVKQEEQIAPLALVKGKENQAQDLSMAGLKARQPLANVNGLQKVTSTNSNINNSGSSNNRDDSAWRPW